MPLRQGLLGGLEVAHGALCCEVTEGFLPVLHPSGGSHSQLLLQTSWDFVLSLDLLE